MGTLDAILEQLERKHPFAKPVETVYQSVNMIAMKQEGPKKKCTCVKEHAPASVGHDRTLILFTFRLYVHFIFHDQIIL